MKAQLFCLAAAAAVASAHNVPTYCMVDLDGTPYNELALRPTPCNNLPAIMMLPNHLWIVDAGVPLESGCGFTYKYVSVRATDGKDYYGWVGTDYIDCGSTPAPPSPPTPPTPPTSWQSCGSYSVKNGGPTNCCGPNAQYTAGDYDMCSANGSNCQAICCTANHVVY
jgi:hypothetical protein